MVALIRSSEERLHLLGVPQLTMNGFSAGKRYRLRRILCQELVNVNRMLQRLAQNASHVDDRARRES